MFYVKPNIKFQVYFLITQTSNFIFGDLSDKQKTPIEPKTALYVVNCFYCSTKNIKKS